MTEVQAEEHESEDDAYEKEKDSDGLRRLPLCDQWRKRIGCSKQICRFVSFTLGDQDQNASGKYVQYESCETGDEDEEYEIVVPSNAGSKPYAVVIKSKHTVVAIVAV